MFEEYLQDSYAFFEIARKSKNDREARRYYRASVFYAAGAIESFTNYIADSFAKAENLTPHEIAFLNDKSLIFDAKKGTLKEKTDYHKLDDKLKILFRKFIPTFDFATNNGWSSLMEFKDFRDSLIHPRQDEDETTTSEYQAKVKRGLGGVIEIINRLSLGIFKKPLRKKILDLIPE
jgi:hypothetical protein